MGETQSTFRNNHYAPSVKMSRESDPDEDRDLNYLDGYWDGYDKAAQQFVDDYYGYGDYTSDESGSDEESSDYTSDESGADEESSDSDSDKDEDHKYTYKYKYKYAYKPSDNPAKPSPNPDKPSDNPDKPSPNPAKPKNKLKDDKQTDQKYSINTVRLWGNDSDSDSD